MRLSISIPQLATDSFDSSGVRSYLTRAEELGFEGGWALEQTVGQAPLIAPMELLAWAASCTTRLRLGVAAMVTSLHDPLQLASAVTRSTGSARAGWTWEWHPAAASARSPPSACRKPRSSGTSLKALN